MCTFLTKIDRNCWVWIKCYWHCDGSLQWVFQEDLKCWGHFKAISTVPTLMFATTVFLAVCLEHENVRNVCFEVSLKIFTCGTSMLQFILNGPPPWNPWQIFTHLFAPSDFHFAFSCWNVVVHAFRGLLVWQWLNSLGILLVAICKREWTEFERNWIT